MAYSGNPRSIIAGSGVTVTPINGTGSNTVVISANGGGDSLLKVTLVDTDYTATNNDYYIGATEKNITVTLPLGITGKVFIVKNQVNGNIKVEGTGGEFLDSSSTKTLGSEASLIAVFDGTRWNLI